MTTESTFSSDSGLFDDAIELPVYTTVQIQVATFFGGPPAATYMIAKNFKQFGDTDMVKKTWLYGIGITLVYLAFFLFIPMDVRFIKFGVSLAIIYGARALVKQWQGVRLDEHLAQGGKVKSNWNVFAVIILSALVILALMTPYFTYLIYNQLQRQNNY